ncbi:MAG: helix-turn-helix domain-containing protein [Acidimicrobiales bacterium]
MTVPQLNNRVVLTVAQVAELAQVSPWTVRRQIAAGLLRAKRIGGCVRVTRTDFDAWLASDGTPSVGSGATLP